MDNKWYDLLGNRCIPIYVQTPGLNNILRFNIGMEIIMPYQVVLDSKYFDNYFKAHDWCTDNTKDTWAMIPIAELSRSGLLNNMNIATDSYSYKFYFKNKDDALMFRLHN